VDTLKGICVIANPYRACLLIVQVDALKDRRGVSGTELQTLQGRLQEATLKVSDLQVCVRVCMCVYMCVYVCEQSLVRARVCTIVCKPLTCLLLPIPPAPFNAEQVPRAVGVVFVCMCYE
jgi:hypothetical protein